jgi:hypothetical protein
MNDFIYIKSINRMVHKKLLECIVDDSMLDSINACQKGRKLVLKF